MGPIRLAAAVFIAAVLGATASCAAFRRTDLSVGGEHVEVLALTPSAQATIVTPRDLNHRKTIDLVLYALPNGNSTVETMGRTKLESVGWRFDIQHIAAQTRAFRARGFSNTVVAYLEADSKSWPSWRAQLGYPRANARIVALVNEVRAAVSGTADVRVTLAAHSGGGSFLFGFIEGQDALPRWLDRIIMLDANYNFSATHVGPITRWLRDDSRHALEVLAYDDREIMLDGKKVVADDGGTFRATARMRAAFVNSFAVQFTDDTIGAFLRARAPQIELLVHPNPHNRILHTEMIGEMNGYLYALLQQRGADDHIAPVAAASLLRPARAYTAFVQGPVILPPARSRALPVRPKGRSTGSRFFQQLIAFEDSAQNSLMRRSSPTPIADNAARAVHEAREAAVLNELLAGNLPPFLRDFRTVRDSALGRDGTWHVIEYDVMPDYLAIGEDADYVRIPMNPYTAQTFADAFGFVLPTRKMVDATWRAAGRRLEPQPLTEARESARAFLTHHRIIETQLGTLSGAARTREPFVAGIKKDVVVTNRLAERGQRLALYGWHHENGVPIQTLYVGHVDWYVDYSHGIRPVRRMMRVDGMPMSFEQIATDSVLHVLVSDEGPLTVTRYDRLVPLPPVRR